MWNSFPGARATACCALATLLALGGCALPSAPLTAPQDWSGELGRWAGTPIIVLGEQHDAAAHQQWEADTVRQLARCQALAAVVIEMAPRGGSTGALASGAGEEQVRQALVWQETAWPWQRYRDVVMAAVQAGVPVLGGNLPRERMKEAMADTRFDHHLPAALWQLQLDAIREGHCDLLPEAQWAPMARIQLARDESLAQTARQAQQELGTPGRSVLVIAGRGHARRDIGLPTWLADPASAKVALARSPAQASTLQPSGDWWQTLPAAEAADHCAQLRSQWRGRPAPGR